VTSNFQFVVMLLQLIVWEKQQLVEHAIPAWPSDNLTSQNRVGKDAGELFEG
jgi:hypothetical protein